MCRLLTPNLQAKAGSFPPSVPHSAARPLSGGPTLATCRGCFCSLPPCSLKPQGAPPVMEMQMKSPVPILSSQLGSMQGRRRRGMRAALGAPSLAGGRASATCARRRARRRRGPGPLPRHAPRSAHLRGGEARAGRTSPCRARWRGGARGPQHRRVESQH